MPIFNFDKHSATGIYPQAPEIKSATAEKRARIGMNRGQVVMALGKPVRKMRETVGDVESDHWIYGTPPGKITCVTFNGNKCIKVKESYARLGSKPQFASAYPVGCHLSSVVRHPLRDLFHVTSVHFIDSNFKRMKAFSYIFLVPTK